MEIILCISLTSIALLSVSFSISKECWPEIACLKDLLSSKSSREVSSTCTIVACFQNSRDFNIIYALAEYTINASPIQLVGDDGKIGAIDSDLAPFIPVPVWR